MIKFTSLFLVVSLLLAPALTPAVMAQVTQPVATVVPGETLDDETVESTAAGELEEVVEEEPEPTPEPTPRADLTTTTESTVGRLEQLLQQQELGPPLPMNPIKYAIRGAVDAGVPANTIVLLLLLPLVVALIAAARHIVGLRGFGIFLPASLAIVFLATGPIIGLGLFLVIVLFSTLARMILKRMKIKLQYLPRMSLILWFVVLGVLLVLFAAPIVRHPDFAGVSIFPVLILVLLAEDFSKVQLGKSARTAVTLASETIILALASFIFLTLEFLQRFALLYPETILLGVVVFNVLLGRYMGLRVMEYWRYRRLIIGDKVK